MKKILLIATIIIFCSGWSVNYELEYKNDKFEENIEIIFEDNIQEVVDSLSDEDDAAIIEFDMLYTNIYATVDLSKKYEKKISDDKKHVYLYAKYTPEEFMNSYYGNLCFENFKLIESKKNYQLIADGVFQCPMQENITININPSKSAIRSNADRVNSKIYTWELFKRIDKIEPPVDINIAFNKSESIFVYVLIALIIIVSFISIGCVVIKSIKNNKLN